MILNFTEILLKDLYLCTRKGTRKGSRTRGKVHRRTEKLNLLLLVDNREKIRFVLILYSGDRRSVNIFTDNLTTLICGLMNVHLSLSVYLLNKLLQ